MRLEDWARHAWTIDPPDLQLYSLSGDTDFIQLSSLPFGCPADPVSGLTLHTTWRDLAEELVTDNDVHSDLEPLEAPEWSVEVSLLDNPDCLLFRHLSAFEALCKDNRSAAELLGELRDEGALDGVHSALDRMGAGQVQAPSISLSPCPPFPSLSLPSCFSASASGAPAATGQPARRTGGLFKSRRCGGVALVPSPPFPFPSPSLPSLPRSCVCGSARRGGTTTGCGIVVSSPLLSSFNDVNVDR